MIFFGMEYLNEAVELLKSLISIPSQSKEEGNAADYIKRYLTQHDCCVHRVGNNLWCEAFSHDDSKPTILLNSHIDTVAASNAWTYPPFEPTLEGDRLYGLGSNDAGAPLCCLIQTFLRIREQAPAQAYNLILGLSCEEEITGKNGIELLMPSLPSVSLAIVGEPTQMHAAIAEKGLMVLDCTVRGVSGHAAHATGVNAIYKAIPAISWFQTAQVPRVSDFLGPVRMSVTIVQSGTKHNIIPDECHFTVDVRVNECYTNQELYQWICSQVCETYGCEVEARSFRLGSSRMDPQHPLVCRCRDLGMELYGSPTLSDQSRMSCPSLKLGPGDSLRSHTSDEYICLSEMRQGLDLYWQLLNGLVI